MLSNMLVPEIVYICRNFQVIIPKSYVLSNCGLGDIAIVELASEVDIAKSHLDTVCLPHANTTAAQLIVGAGFGMDREIAYRLFLNL